MIRVTHDQLFRRIFSDRKAQQDLVSLALPEGLVATFRMETLRDVSDQVHGEETPDSIPSRKDAAEEQRTSRAFPRPGQIDLLLSVEDISSRIHLVYVLVEHKSYPDNRVALQLLHYMAGLWRQWNQLPLPVIHPVVLYHGKRRWTAPKELVGLHTYRSGQRRSPGAGDTAFNTEYPANLRYHLLDLNTMDPQQLKRSTRAQAYAGLIAFKYVMRRLAAPEMRQLLRASASPDMPTEVRRALWIYILEYLPEEERTRIVTEADQMEYTIEGERMYSIADSLRDEGIELGRREGIELGRVEESQRILLRQLEKRFGLTESERALVMNCAETDRLETAADLLVDPDPSKDSVLRLLQSGQLR